MPDILPSDSLLDAAGREPYLVFRLAESHYAVRVDYVREIVQLPALQPAAEHAAYFVGLINLRGSIVPTMDLNIRFGHPTSPYSIDDQLLVLQHADGLLALVVNAVHGVERIAADTTQATISASIDGGQQQHFVTNTVNVDDKIVLLLDIETMLATVEDQPTVGDVTTSPATPITNEHEAELHHRAHQLRQPLDAEQPDDTLAVAVAQINAELFALEFEFIREFHEAQQVTPVPCCPRHIIGNVNVRGDILTVVDIRGLLNLPPAAPGTTGKLILVEIEAFLVGLLVDELYDVVYLQATQLRGIPGGIAAEGYIKATAPYGDEIMSVLDLTKLLTDDLAVNEEVARV